MTCLLVPTPICPAGADHVGRREPANGANHQPLYGHGQAIEVPDLRFEPITPSRDQFQVLPGEFVPLALDPAFRLRPHAFDHRPNLRSPLRYALSCR
jgi:hypothetical protein